MTELFGLWRSAQVSVRAVGLGLVTAFVAVPGLSQPSAVPVSVVRVQSAPVHDEIPLSGTVVARRFVRMSPRVAGYIRRVVVEAGDEVGAGDVIIELDDKLAVIELATVKSALEEAKIRYSEAVRLRDEALQLVSKNHIAGTEVATAQAQVAIVGVGVTRLSAQLRREQEIFNQHTVTAPFAGVIAVKLVEMGQWVETSTALVELSEIAHLRVEVPMPQTYFNVVKVGTPVELRLDALPGLTLDAAVSAVIPVGSSDARTFPLRIDIDNQKRLVAPGMSVMVRVFANRAQFALLLPRDAIVREASGSETVWQVAGNERVTTVNKVSVRTGRSTQNLIEVVSVDLNDGDRVIVHGNERLVDGQTVEIIEEIDLAP